MVRFEESLLAPTRQPLQTWRSIIDCAVIPTGRHMVAIYAAKKGIRQRTALTALSNGGRSSGMMPSSFAKKESTVKSRSQIMRP